MHVVGRAMEIFRARQKTPLKSIDLSGPGPDVAHPAEACSPEPGTAVAVDSFEVRKQSLQQQMRNAGRAYELLIEEQRSLLRLKDDEIARLNSALNDLWSVAVAQLEALRRADEERAAKDKQVNELLLMMARYQKVQANEVEPATRQTSAAHWGRNEKSHDHDESLPHPTRFDMAA